MPYLIDVYSLAPSRSVVAIERFLNHFMPSRVRADADYTVTLDGIRYLAKFDTPEELAIYCESHQEAESRAYWNNHEACDPHSAHVFFLPAGGLVFGLSVASSVESEWNRWLEELMTFVEAEFGYWTGECPPENTVTEFIQVARKTGRTARFA